jgi:ribosome-associated translation inhibitor RaiA
MDVPPEIAFRHVEPTAALKSITHESIDSLEKVHPRLTSCRVMVEETSRGVPHIRLDIGVPGGDLVVNREAPDDPASRNLPSAVHDAFDVARRQLREQHKRIVDGKRRGNSV